MGLSSTFLVLLFILAVRVSSTATVTVCSVPTDFSLAANLHARFAVQLYSPTFPAINWKYEFIGSSEATPRNFVSALTINGSSCNVFLGPGSSSVATAMSPLMSMIWVDFSSTSTELSDKSLFPLFSRVVPSDSTGAAGLLAVTLAFGWTSVNIYCDSTSYGNSYSSMLSTLLVAAGGSVQTSHCMSADATYTDVDGAVSDFLASGTRVLVVVMDPTSTAFSMFHQSLKTRGLLTGTFIYLFSESFCSGVPTAQILDLEGAICATYAINSTRYDEFLAQYETRNISAESRDLSNHGWDVSQVNFTQSSVFPAFAVDAAYIAMATVNATFGRGLTAAAQESRLRSISFEGLSGLVSLNTNGDRIGGDMLVYNSFGGSMNHRIMTITNSTAHLADSALQDGIFVLGSIVSVGGLHNLQFFPSTVDKHVLSPQMIVAVVIGAIVFFVVLALSKSVMQTDIFKRLVRSGLWVVAIQVIVLGGSIILRIATALNVALGSYPLGFVVCFLLISSFSVVVHSAEVVILLLWFAQTIQSADDLSEQETVTWEFRVAQAHLISVGVDDIPLIAMNFAAMQQEDVTFTVLVSMCLSCVFVGMKFTQLKNRIMRYLNAPPQTVRKFKTFRSVVLHVIVARRFNKNFRAEGLGRNSTADELKRYRQISVSENPERVKFLRKASKSLVVMLSNQDIQGDEYFAFVRDYLFSKFDPTHPTSPSAPASLIPNNTKLPQVSIGESNVNRKRSVTLVNDVDELSAGEQTENEI